MKYLTKDERIDLLRVQLIKTRNFYQILIETKVPAAQRAHYDEHISEINFTLKTTDHAIKRQTEIPGITNDIFRRSVGRPDEQG